jgi:hypothetical protein
MHMQARSAFATNEQRRLMLGTEDVAVDVLPACTVMEQVEYGHCISFRKKNRTEEADVCRETAIPVDVLPARTVRTVGQIDATVSFCKKIEQRRLMLAGTGRRPRGCTSSLHSAQVNNTSRVDAWHRSASANINEQRDEVAHENAQRHRQLSLSR